MKHRLMLKKKIICIYWLLFISNSAKLVYMTSSKISFEWFFCQMYVLEIKRPSKFATDTEQNSGVIP